MAHDVLGEDSNFQVVGNLYGTHAARPSAGGVLDGMLYIEIDTGTVVQAQTGVWVVVDAVTDETTAIATEVTRAEAAESTLTTNLAAEITRAEAAEAELDTDLGEEATRAEAAEATLTTNLGAEVTRAEAAESTLTTNLATETTRAEAAEGLLATRASPVFTGPATLAGLRVAITSKTSAYPVTTNDCVIIGDTSGADFTVTLPDATTCQGQVFWFKNVSATNTLTIATSASQTINTISTYTLANGPVFAFTATISDGANWWTIDG